MHCSPRGLTQTARGQASGAMQRAEEPADPQVHQPLFLRDITMEKCVYTHPTLLKITLETSKCSKRRHAALQKLVILLYIRNITNQKLFVVCQGDRVSGCCVLGKNSQAKACPDLCQHYWFITTLVTSVLKICCSINSFSRNFSNF